MLPKKALLLEAALFEDARRCRVVREDMGRDLHQPELLEGVPAYCLQNGRHDTPAPKWLRQPVADLAAMRLADLEAVEAAGADQRVVARTDRPINRAALLPGDLGDQGDP